MTIYTERNYNLSDSLEVIEKDNKKKGRISLVKRNDENNNRN